MSARNADPLASVVETVLAGAGDDREVAVRLHDVADRVRFGFTPWFDAADDVRTWTLGVGHCNPQARLVVGLLRRGRAHGALPPVTIDARARMVSAASPSA